MFSTVVFVVLSVSPKNVRRILIMCQNAHQVNSDAVLLYPFHFRMSSSTWSEELWTQWRLWSKVSHIWLLTLWSRFMHYRSKWKAPHQSCSSAWRVCRHKSDPEPSCSWFNRPSSCIWVCYLFECKHWSQYYTFFHLIMIKVLRLQHIVKAYMQLRSVAHVQRVMCSSILHGRHFVLYAHVHS